MKFFLFLFLLIPVLGYSQSNILIYGKGDTQVTSEINQYTNVVAGMPIFGSVMVTHDKANKIDENSFRLGDKPLKVKLIQTIPMSSYSNLEVAVYGFQLQGMDKGIHTLPPIKVKVGGQESQAPPLVIAVIARDRAITGNK